MSSTDEIVLGEGVAIESGAASVVMRAGSGAIDFIVYYGALWIAMQGLMNSGALDSMTDLMFRTVVIVILVVVLIVAPAVVETLTRGLSVGRLAVGLRIVRDDGGPISVRYAFGRALVGFFEVYLTFGIMAVVASFLSSKGKRIGDMLVGTYSMRTRGGRTSLAPVAMPFGMAEWASAADISRLPDGLALTARLFLSRVRELSPEARYRLGTQIAQSIEPFVAPHPPHGTHPEVFIAAVLASRRDREYAAAMRAERIASREYDRLSKLPFGIADADN